MESAIQVYSLCSTTFVFELTISTLTSETATPSSKTITIHIPLLTMTVTNPNTVDPLINALGQMNLHGGPPMENQTNAVEANTDSTDKVSNDYLLWCNWFTFTFR